MGELIVVQTEYERLIEEIKRLRARIAELIAERDELVNHICPDLQAEYDLKIGGLMLQAMEAENRMRILKRTLELMQAQINHGKTPSYREAKEQTEEEYQEYQQKINDKAEEIKKSREYTERKAKRRGTQIVSTRKDDDCQKDTCHHGGESDDHRGDFSELKHLYRKIVKRIHPDINPDITEEEKELFNRATKAYNEEDLDALRNIYHQLQAGGNLRDEFRDTEEDLIRLRQIRDTLRVRVLELEAEIARIKSDFPYNQKAFLADEAAVTAKQEELRKYIMDCTEQAAILDGRIKNLREQGCVA